MMIKIKTFTHFNDVIINEFLKQTKGKIVNYSPIVVEYDGDKTFKDPYEGFNAYLCNIVLKYTSMLNIDKGNFKIKDEAKLYYKKIDTILIPLSHSKNCKFMCEGKVVLIGSEDFYYNITFEESFISTYDYQGEGYKNIDFNFRLWEDVGNGHNFQLEYYLIDNNCKRLNYG